ncbi:hypothetical protein BDL97_16G027400 [Sphagnum fallax]|nr:hypothetical protein BDL97_16G027400 [Sphagnum fallax]
MKHPALLQLLCLVCIILLPLSSTLPFVTCTSSVVAAAAAADSQTGLGALDSSCSSPEEGYSITTTATTKAVTAARGSSSAAAAIGELQELTAETVMELSSGGFEGSSSSKSSRESQSLVEPFMMQPTTNKARQARRFKSRRMLAPNRVCTNKDISIFQGQDGSSGIPQYIVQIVNTCLSNCAPSDIHVYCGWFASALLVNPNIFSRVAFNDCLVNGGRPLRPGDIIRFEYANSFMYPIRFKSASFC